MLYDRVPRFERFFRILAENALVAARQRVLDNISANATDRYLAFAKQYPEFVDRVPQNQIASYLGVTPEFLSKMRAQLRRKM